MLTLTARAVTTTIKRATGSDLFTSRLEPALGVVRVSQRYAVAGALTPDGTSSARREDRARLAAAALLQAGYEVARSGDRLTVTLPVREVEEPAVEVEAPAATVLGRRTMRERADEAIASEDAARAAITTRPVGVYLDEVALGGQAIGRTLGHDTDLVDAYTTTGERIGQAMTRADAHALLVERATPTAGTPLAERPVQLAHLMGDNLLAACGSTGDPLGLYVVPFTCPDSVTCPACRPLVEQVRRATVDADHGLAPVVPTAVEGFHATAETIAQAVGPAALLDRLAARREHLQLAELEVGRLVDDVSADALLADENEEEPTDGRAPGSDGGGVSDPGRSCEECGVRTWHPSGTCDPCLDGVPLDGSTPGDRLAARHGVSVDEVHALTGEVLDRTPGTDALDEHPRPMDSGEVVPSGVRIAVDADCPGCGYPERSYDPARGVFGCSSLRSAGPCGYESTERNA